MSDEGRWPEKQMPKPRFKYVETVKWSREAVEEALRADRPEQLLRAVIAVSMLEADFDFAQGLCLRLAKHPHFNVRGNAVLGFGHIARVHGRLDQAVVQPIIREALRDPEEYVRGQAEDAKDDTAHFLKWSYEK